MFSFKFKFKCVSVFRKGLCALKRTFGLRILSIDHHLVQG